MIDHKPLLWVGSSLEDVRSFPDEARREMGLQLRRVQAGLDPEDWKPFASVGAGVREIRVRDASGAFRVMYVAKFPEGIYVLHAFRKTTQATAKEDKHIASVRYRSVIKERGQS